MDRGARAAAEACVDRFFWCSRSASTHHRIDRWSRHRWTGSRADRIGVVSSQHATTGTCPCFGRCTRCPPGPLLQALPPPRCTIFSRCVWDRNRGCAAIELPEVKLIVRFELKANSDRSRPFRRYVGYHSALNPATWVARLLLAVRKSGRGDTCLFRDEARAA